VGPAVCPADIAAARAKISAAPDDVLNPKPDIGKRISSLFPLRKTLSLPPAKTRQCNPLNGLFKTNSISPFGSIN